LCFFFFAWWWCWGGGGPPTGGGWGGGGGRGRGARKHGSNQLKAGPVGGLSVGAATGRRRDRRGAPTKPNTHTDTQAGAAISNRRGRQGGPPRAPHAAVHVLAAVGAGLLQVHHDEVLPHALHGGAQQHVCMCERVVAMCVGGGEATAAVMGGRGGWGVVGVCPGVRAAENEGHSCRIRQTWEAKHAGAAELLLHSSQPAAPSRPAGPQKEPTGRQRRMQRRRVLQQGSRRRQPRAPGWHRPAGGRAPRWRCRWRAPPATCPSARPWCGRRTAA
jgi:hypothetical protein